MNQFKVLVLILGALAAPNVAAMIIANAVIDLQVDGRDIGSPVRLDIASGILTCNNHSASR